MAERKNFTCISCGFPKYASEMRFRRDKTGTEIILANTPCKKCHSLHVRTKRREYAELVLQVAKRAKRMARSLSRKCTEVVCREQAEAIWKLLAQIDKLPY